jgi:hypothetical protein
MEGLKEMYIEHEMIAKVNMLTSATSTTFSHFRAKTDDTAASCDYCAEEDSRK